jgi:ribosomal-protein-alanine N-acetyltransferase
MTVEISAATMEDVPSVVAIEQEAFSDPWTAIAFQDALAHPAVYFACAQWRNVRSLVMLWPGLPPDEGEIANLAVAPSGWGSGTGRRLLNAALSEALTRGAAAVYLEVRDSNDRARRLYPSSGFEEVGRRRRYYRRPVEDAIVLRRTLTQDV